MTWIVGKLINNPAVLLWLVIAAFAAGIATGGSAAWTIQGLRLTSAEQEFTKYKQDQTTARQEAKDAADLQRENSSAAYAAASQKLNTALAAGDALRRCVAAGRCGVRVPIPATCPGYSLPSTVRANDPGADAVPIAGVDAAINDCARTTLMINQLQADIEAQPGYSREVAQ